MSKVDFIKTRLGDFYAEHGEVVRFAGAFVGLLIVCILVGFGVSRCMYPITPIPDAPSTVAPTVTNTPYTPEPLPPTPTMTRTATWTRTNTPTISATFTTTKTATSFSRSTGTYTPTPTQTTSPTITVTPTVGLITTPGRNGITPMLPETGLSAQGIAELTSTPTPTATELPKAPPLPECPIKWQVEYYEWRGYWRVGLYCPNWTATPSAGAGD